MRENTTQKLELALKYLKYAKKFTITAIGLVTAILAALNGEGELAAVVGVITSAGVFQATNGEKPRE